MRHLFRSTVLGATLALVSCVPAGEEQARAQDEAALQSAIQSWFTAWDAGDAAELAALYAPDAVRLPPDAPDVRGEEILTGTEKWFASFPEHSMEWESREILLAGDRAVQWGWYSLTGTPAETGPQYTESGRWAWSWRKEADGTWLIVWEIWNREPPAETGPQEPEAGLD